MVSRYITAFANHEGGHIFFGIDDVKAAAMGEFLSDDDQEKTGISVILTK
jgi:predicted HTH transcriptional regulator